MVDYEYDSLYKKNGYSSVGYPEITFGHASLEKETATKI